MNSSVPSSEIRDDGIEFSCEFYLGFNEIKFGYGFDGGFDRRKLFTKFFGQSEQDPRDLAFLLTFEILQLVIRFDGFERLDEDGLTARRKSVCDTTDLSAEIGLYRNHKRSLRMVTSSSWIASPDFRIIDSSDFVSRARWALISRRIRANSEMPNRRLRRSAAAFC
jgi:hypothetical protein